MPITTSKYAELYLENIIASMPGHVYLKDRDGIYIACNDLQAKFIGFSSRKEIIGKTDYDLSSHDKAEALRKNDLEVMSAGKLHTFEEVVTLADGTEAILLSEKAPFYNENSEIIGVLGISIDISDRKRAEKALQEAKEQAEAANIAKSEFLAVMSHELRTPLNAILGMAQILRLGNLAVEELEYADTIFQAGSNLLLLIDDVLAFSKFEAGKLSIISDPFDLRELIDEVIGIFAHQALEKNVELIIDYPPTIPQTFIGDARRIRQVLVNLIGNAIKFTFKGHILTTVESLGNNGTAEELLIKVADTGIGMPADKLDYIFERFTQINSTYSRPYQGTGLGLSITKRLVEMMDGHISVQSMLGSGSTFSIKLSLPLQYSAINFSPWEPYRESTRVLIVDENHFRGEGLASRVAPYRGNLAAGDEALETLLKAQRAGDAYHIVVIDQKITTVDPLSLGKSIKTHLELSAIVIILLTDAGREPGKQIMAVNGFFTNINKPLSPAGFLQVLSKEWRRWLVEADPDALNNFLEKSMVLLVEDNVLNQQVAKLMLEKMSCQVDIADNGAMALRMLEQKCYNLIFMDIGLPDMDGLTLTAEVRRREVGKRRIPIIAITAHVFERDIEQCFAAGMDDVITKPLLREQLLMLLRRWVPWGANTVS